MQCGKNPLVHCRTSNAACFTAKKAASIGIFPYAGEEAPGSVAKKQRFSPDKTGRRRYFAAFGAFLRGVFAPAFLAGFVAVRARQSASWSLTMPVACMNA